MKAKSKYAVSLARDERGWWVATLPEIPGCHSQGRTIEQARERVREALQAWFDLEEPYAGELVDNVELGKAPPQGNQFGGGSSRASQVG